MQFTPETKKKIKNWCHRLSTIFGFALVLLPDMQDFQSAFQVFAPDWPHWNIVVRILGGTILLLSKLDSILGRLEKKFTETKSDSTGNMPATSLIEDPSNVITLPPHESPREIPGSEDITQVIPRTDPSLSK